MERNQQQQEVVKILKTPLFYVSMWEHKRKSPHPKYVKAIVDYLGYIPIVHQKHERLGTCTQLYRMKHDLSLQEFCQIGNIDIHVVEKLETARFCKVNKDQEKRILKLLRRNPKMTP